MKSGIKRFVFNFLDLPHSGLGVRLGTSPQDEEKLLLSVDDIEFNFSHWMEKNSGGRVAKSIVTPGFIEMWFDYEKDGMKVTLNYQEPWGWFLFSDSVKSNDWVRELHEKLAFQMSKR